jgi:hypothetical protein
MKRAALLALTLLGCAAAPRRAPRYCPSPEPSGRTALREIQSRPTAVSESVTSTSDRAEEPAEEVPPCVPAPRDASITALEGDIARGLAAFATTEPGCRDVCRAAEGVCGAAREICRLTGDGDAAQPADARCERARRSCTDASRQRDARCPVCPAA